MFVDLGAWEQSKPFKVLGWIILAMNITVAIVGVFATLKDERTLSDYSMFFTLTLISLKEIHASFKVGKYDHKKFAKKNMQLTWKNVFQRMHFIAMDLVGDDEEEEDGDVEMK